MQTDEQPQASRWRAIARRRTRRRGPGPTGWSRRWGQWSAIENGTHYRRDVSLGEDACRVRDRGAAGVMASLRNLTIGVYELEKHRGRTKADSLPSWRRAQSFTTAMAALKR